MTTIATVSGVEIDLDEPIKQEYRNTHPSDKEFYIVAEANRVVFSRLAGRGVYDHSSRGRMIKGCTSEYVMHTTVPNAIAAATISAPKAHSFVTYMPSNFVRPTLNEDGSVKSGIRFRVGMLVFVEQHTSGGGISTSFIGAVEDAEGDSLRVRVLMPAYHYNSSPISLVRESIYLHRKRYATIEQRAQEMGKSYTFNKRSCRIIDPYTLTPMHWATLNMDLRMPRYIRPYESKLATKYDERAIAGYRKFSWTADYYKDLGQASIDRAKGKLKARLLAMMIKGDDRILNIRSTSYRATVIYKTILKFFSKRERAVIGAQGTQYIGNFISASREIGSAIDLFNEKYASDENPHITSADSCGHYVRMGQQIIVYHGSSRRTVCPGCFRTGNYREALDAAGNTVMYHTDYSLHTWADGTRRVVEEPPIVGSYHSSKVLNREVKLPPEYVPFAPSGLTMGIELEMESAEGSIDDEKKRSNLARLVLNRMVKAQDKIGLKSHRYGYFERDGSVNDGFELVTGWGELAMHQYFIRNIFGAVDGEDKLPFVGKLRSHDASASCGLHVHLAKPKTLTHAVKLQSFYNSPENKRLIHSVARRYDVSYTKVVRNCEKERVMATTGQAIRNTGYSIRGMKGGSRENVISRAIRNLSSERYQAVNFTPEKTVEVRIFKGSMLPNTILACIEFAHASWFFSRDTKADKLTSDEFLRYIADPCRRHETPHLRAYLAARGYATYTPRFREGVTEVVEHDFNSSNA